jgi:hypothetical protein
MALKNLDPSMPTESLDRAAEIREFNHDIKVRFQRASLAQLPPTQGKDLRTLDLSSQISVTMTNPARLLATRAH